EDPSTCRPHQCARRRVVPARPEAEGGKQQLEQRKTFSHRQESNAAMSKGKRTTAAAIRYGAARSCSSDRNTARGTSTTSTARRISARRKWASQERWRASCTEPCTVRASENAPAMPTSKVAAGRTSRSGQPVRRRSIAQAEFTAFPAPSERDVPVLALGDFLPLVAQHLQSATKLRPRVLGEDHLVHISELRGLVRGRERVAVFLHQI